MTAAVRVEPLVPAHLEELAAVLHDPAVYEHIAPELPPRHEILLGLQRALAGPPPSTPDERWLNFLLRDASGAMVGRLEATVHHGLAEVAFLLGPRHWGRGFGSAGLRWLHEEIARSAGITDFWATTTPANARSRSLLERCGYRASTLPDRPLYSHDAGDLVFNRRVPA